MTHICVGNLAIIGSDNGLSLGRRQLVIWTFRNKLQWKFNRNSNIFIWKCLQNGGRFASALMRLSDIYASVQHTNITSDNGLVPVRCQAIIWTNAAIFSIRPQVTYISEIICTIKKYSFMEIHLKMASAKLAAILSRPQCVKADRIWKDFRFRKF